MWKARKDVYQYTFIHHVEKTRKGVSVLDMGGKPKIIIPVHIHVVPQRDSNKGPKGRRRQRKDTSTPTLPQRGLITRPGVQEVRRRVKDIKLTGFQERMYNTCTCSSLDRVVWKPIQPIHEGIFDQVPCFSSLNPSLDTHGVTGLFLQPRHASGTLYHLIFDLVFVPQSSSLFSKLILCHRFSMTNFVVSVFLCVVFCFCVVFGFTVP